MPKPPPTVGQTPGLGPGRSVTRKPSQRSTPTRPYIARLHSVSPTPAWLAFGAIWARTLGPRKTSSAGFGEPIVSGDRAAVEWWGSWREQGQELTFAGVTVLRF